VKNIENDVITFDNLDDRETKDWRAIRGIILLYSGYKTEGELRRDFENFIGMPLGDRRESDWKSIDLYGSNNTDRYNKMLSVFLKNDIENDDLYSNYYAPVRESADGNIRIGFVGYSDSVFDVNKAITIIEKIFVKISKMYDKNKVEIVSGYTNLGIPKLVYEKANELGFKTVGIACKKANEYDVFPCDKVIIKGEEWGDESETFLNYIDAIYKIGGGKQSESEFKSMKKMSKPAIEYRLDRIGKPVKESAMERAEEWNNNSLNKIITKATSLKDLETQWERYQAIPIHDRNKLDTTSTEIFGINNTDHYNSQKRDYVKKDIENPKPDVLYTITKEEALLEYASNTDPITSALTCIRLQESAYPNSKILCEKAEKELDDKISMDNMMAMSITPYFTPSQMEKLGLSVLDVGGMYSNEPDNVIIGDISTKEWFLEYKNRFNGYDDTSYTSQSAWVESMKKLYSDYEDIKESGDINKINSRKQSILDLGWNPEIDFNEETRILATNRINSILNEEYSRYRIIDIEQSVSLMNENFVYNESENGPKIKPIFVVFFNTKNLFNKIARLVDKSVYSHVSISFNPSLKTLYSFDAKHGGFHTEYLKDFIEEGNVKAIQVFCTFVDEERYHKMKNRISNFHKDKEQRGYSFLNLITIPLKINYINQSKMVCSQFVDSMLKLADLDTTHMVSSIISPGNLNRHIKKFKGDMYKIFTGDPKNYNTNKVGEFINNLTSVIQTHTESSVLNSFLSVNPIREEFGIQFTDDGDLLISKGKDIDFEGEYSRCHMALMEYDKAKNTEAMKYCICKLWYLNIILEERINEENSSKDKDREKLKSYHKARAKILNDIKTYMKRVQRLDKDFDIIKEYNDSPFNDKNIRIRRSTILYAIELAKRLIGIKR